MIIMIIIIILLTTVTTVIITIIIILTIILCTKNGIRQIEREGKCWRIVVPSYSSLEF